MSVRNRRPTRTLTRALLAMAAAGALLLQAATPVAAAAGELDDTFDGNGKLLLNMTPGDEYFSDVAVQTSDQKLVVVGSIHPTDGEWFVARLNTDGSFDGAFGGGDGIVPIDFSTGEDYANAVAIQADGKIVVVGRAGLRWGIVRLNTDGTLDSGFSGDGKATIDFTAGQEYATDVAIQGDQKVVVSGFTAAADSRFTAVRFTTAGVLDSSFSGDGIASLNLTTGQDLAYSVAIDSNSKIVLTGYASGLGGQIGLARLGTSGSPDSGFSGDGMLVRNFGKALDVATSVAIQPADDKIVLSGLTGSSNTKMLALRYNIDGTPDTTFSGNGNLAIDITSFQDNAYGVAVQNDGKVVLCGSANFEFYTIVRLDTDGTTDTSFGDDGIMFSNLNADYDVAYSVAIQADGAIVAVGTSGGSGGRLSAARFLGS